MITGASSGLGEALAHAFYQCGCKVILVARRKEKLEEVKSALMHIHHVSIGEAMIVKKVNLFNLIFLNFRMDRHIHQ